VETSVFSSAGGSDIVTGIGAIRSQVDNRT